MALRSFGASVRQASGRRTFIRPAYELAKRVMPKISPTERAALDSGMVSFDGALFSGAPQTSQLAKYYATLTPEEKSFLDNEVEELCEMLDDYAIVRDMDLPAEAWDFIKRKGFFGLIIPKQHGGKGFSAHGHSQVVQKIATRSSAAAVTVMVPNSLGPGELLMRYGTETQREYYLPKLASGEMIPCFGLTGPASGSDAASMRDTGIVVEKDGVLGVSVTFNKRYITLAPVAHVVGLAFNLQDPNGLLKGKGSEGITIALLERAHEGLNIGRRHDPLSTAFMNGPLSGEGVFVPMACLLGGQERAGYGWNMLMECLAEGRGISLPALSVGAAQTASNAVGAYARVRKQFKVPIAELEGVQEQLAAIASSTYRMNACQALMNGILNAHEQPPVLSAIMKYQMTARMRSVVNQAMDILGGAGICKGKANFMGNSYQQIPIGITVEGANILTRSLIVFGQGLNRSHPNLLGLIESINKGDDMRGFNQHLARLVGHAATNAVGAVGGALATALRAPFGKGADVAAYHEVQLGRLARAFAISADLSLVLGGKLKFAEMLSGRFADVLGNLYSGYAMLHYHKTHHCADSDKVLDHAMSELLYETQQSLFAIQANFPVPGIGLLMRALTFPLGGSYAMPSDRLNQQVSALITTDSQVRKLLSPNIFISRNDPNDRIALINRALPKCLEADAILAAVRKAKRAPTSAEQAVINEAEAMREEIIQVDSFDKLGREAAQPDYVRPALISPYGGAERVAVAAA
ncbi:hypothetical protein KFE25_003991 [Diacronema lutheri]|uniref:Acyl-coenzyme A dehydrogenase n=1 Tax=Diacronema lutheri TaxID=2081491 RepID=A0A8J6CDN3_DIALT|nr:hypothetical protein KFE25_003991 [Diacronema lutheri]